MIEFKNVSFSYEGQRDGLKEINLTIEDGECVLFCGRSGCGKTSMTRLVNGLIPNFYRGELKGEVLLDGQNINELPMYQISEKVGSVFQNPRTQFFNMDTDSEIAFGIENEAWPRDKIVERVQQTAKDLHIENLLGRNIFQLSGGEKQKIAFASVYAMNPKIYLLDEPSSNLDMKSIHELKEHLTLVKSMNKTILIAEHRLYYLMDLVDRIVYMEEGRIKKIYTPDELRELPDEERQKMGLRSVNLSAERIEANSSSSGQEILNVKDVSLFYKKVPVLEHIDFQASQGEVIAIAGTNGSGKTTFSRALCGLHKEKKGSIERKGSSKNSYMVMQDVNYQLFAESVEAECSFGIKDPDQNLVEETLKDLALYSLKDRHPNTLSGGQKQRVAVAVSMICKKDLLVFDEPTSGLDYDSMNFIVAVVRKLSAAGKLIFVVTHDYEFVCRSCHRILNFADGSLQDDFFVTKENQDRMKQIFSINDIKERK